MARATGANAKMALAFESVYGTSPNSGYIQMPFVSSAIGDEQNLIESDLLGQGREPLAPSRDVVNNEGDVVVPVDERYFGHWLKLLLGAPSTAQGDYATGSFAFDGQPEDGSTITIGGADWTFVDADPTGDQSLVGSTLAQTLKNAVVGLNKSATSALASQYYSLNDAGDTIIVTAKTPGTSANSVTLAASDSGDDADSNATPSGSTLSGGASTGAYNHTFQSGASSLPSASIEIGNPEVPSYGMNKGARANKMTIGLQRSGQLTATFSLICQGETKSGSTGAGSPTTLDFTRFSQFQGEITKDGVKLGHVVSAEVSYSNNLDKVEVIRSDGKIEDADPGNIAVNVSLTVRFADTELLDQATNGTGSEIKFGWVIDEDASLMISAKEIYLPKAKNTINGPGGIQATFAGIGSKDGSGKSFTVALRNDVSSYA